MDAGFLVGHCALRRYVMGAEAVGHEATESKLATAKQANGQTWVAYNGHPLYRFTNDAAAGDINGQGLANVWHAVTPQGNQLAS